MIPNTKVKATLIGSIFSPSKPDKSHGIFEIKWKIRDLLFIYYFFSNHSIIRVTLEHAIAIEKFITQRKIIVLHSCIFCVAILKNV